MGIVPLHWDSEFFGLRIAKAIVASEDDVFALAEKEKYLRSHFDLIYIFSESGIDIPFERARLVDRKAVFTSSSLSHFESDPTIVSWDSPIASPSLVSLALVSGKYSRFKLDPGFPIGCYERLYTRWIEQSVNKTMATEVFCYMMDDEPRGLVTLNRQNEENTIGLVAVDGSYQHLGIGTALIRYAISFVHEHKGKHLTVATQLDNEPACRLYSKCGFCLDSVKPIWHWWL